MTDELKDVIDEFSEFLNNISPDIGDLQRVVILAKASSFFGRSYGLGVASAMGPEPIKEEYPKYSGAETGGQTYSSERAFPGPAACGTSQRVHEGISVRDYFAAAALNGILSCHDEDYGTLLREETADDAYLLADFMMEHRGKCGEQE